MLTIQELNEIKKKKEKLVAVRHHRDDNTPNESGYKYQVLVCWLYLVGLQGRCGGAEKRDR